MIPVLFTELNAAIPFGPGSEGPTPTDRAGLSDFMRALAPPARPVPKAQINGPGPEKTGTKVGQATPVVKFQAEPEIPETSSPLIGEAPPEPSQVSDPDDPQNVILPTPDPSVPIMFPPPQPVPPAWFFAQMPPQSVGPAIAASRDPIDVAQSPQDSTPSGDHWPAIGAVNERGQHPDFGSAAALAPARDLSGDSQSSGNSPRLQTALIALKPGDATFDAPAIRPSSQDVSSNTAPKPQEIQISPALASGESGSLQPTLDLRAVPNRAYLKDGDRTAPGAASQSKAASYDSSRTTATMWQIAASGLTTTRLTEPPLPTPPKTTQTFQVPAWAAIKPSVSPLAHDSFSDLRVLASAD